MKFFLSALVSFACTSASLANDTSYYRADMRVPKNAATQYVVTEKTTDGRFTIQGYSLDNILLFRGHSLKQDSIIQHGDYTIFYANGQVAEKQNYMFGRPVGNWTKYYDSSTIVWSTISFNPSSDTLEVLRSYYLSGKLKRIQYKMLGKEKGICFDESGNKISFTPFETPPSFKGRLNAFLKSNIHFPNNVSLPTTGALILVSFAIDENGDLVDISPVDTSFDSKLTDVAVNAVKKMKGRWRPGIRDDKPVKVYYTLPVLFRL